MRKHDCPYKIIATEKGLSKMLLGVRGVKHVIIEGRGKMHEDFADLIKTTLVQPPGTE